VTLRTARNKNRAIPDNPPGNAGNKRVRRFSYWFMGGIHPYLQVSERETFVNHQGSASFSNTFGGASLGK
jgi:hypothetical protein